MSRKPVPAQSGERSRTELLFDRPQLLSRLFGQYDQNLVALENRLGVYITARGNRVQVEGSAESVALARDVLNGLHTRILQGQDIDPGMVDAVIALAAQPTLDGIISAEKSGIPPIMIRTRKKTIVPRTIAQTHYMRDLIANDWFQTVATINPVSYLIEGFRSLFVVGWDGEALVLAFGVALAILAFGMWAAAAALRTRMERT